MKYLKDFIIFIYKQAYACIFWGAFLFVMIITHFWYPLEWVLYRYDFFFLFAIFFQIFLIVMRLETWKEVGIIATFHIVAMLMEIFKTNPSIWSWSYPGEFIIGIMWVPLSAGFMYSAVGSYIVRVSRIFSFQYDNYPKKIYTIIIAIAIYINFFSHHFIWDMRYIIIIAIMITFGQTRIYFKPATQYYSMNLAFGFFLVSIFIWIAENIGTYFRFWVYPSQSTIWHMVGYEKITAWFLLMIISFVLVSLIHKPEKYIKH